MHTQAVQARVALGAEEAACGREGGEVARGVRLPDFLGHNAAWIIADRVTERGRARPGLAVGVRAASSHPARARTPFALPSSAFGQGTNAPCFGR